MSKTQTINDKSIIETDAFIVEAQGDHITVKPKNKTISIKTTYPNRIDFKLADNNKLKFQYAVYVTWQKGKDTGTQNIISIRNNQIITGNDFEVLQKEILKDNGFDAVTIQNLMYLNAVEVQHEN